MSAGRRQRRCGSRQQAGAALHASEHPHNTSRHCGRWGAALRPAESCAPARAGPALACKLSSRLRDGRSCWQAPGGCKQRERACRKWSCGCGEQELVLCCAMGTGMAGRTAQLQCKGGCVAREEAHAATPCSRSSAAPSAAPGSPIASRLVPQPAAHLAHAPGAASFESPSASRCWPPSRPSPAPPAHPRTEGRLPRWKWSCTMP